MFNIQWFSDNVSYIVGSVPIVLGKRAVDPVTGDLSPISGVRVNPETNTVVPVTLASGGHKKRKPPLGAVAMLDEEVVARRGFWRRQRQREVDLTKSEFLLALQLMFDADNISAKKVDSMLGSFLEGAHELNESAKEETKRRSDAEEEFASVLPPDVAAVLTEGDQTERESEESHHASHRKFVEVMRKFLNKIRNEEKKYKDRLAELDGAMNPTAEETVHQRYKQTKTRLHADLRDQIMNRMEHLDEEHSKLEYVRQKNELLTLEAKAILTGVAYIAGDYDCMLSGMYGESDLASPTSSSEMIPLLKQLIAMLQSGGPFVLSPELLNIIQGGQDTNINMQGGNTFIQGTQVHQGQQQVKLAAAQPGQESDKRVISQAVGRSAGGNVVGLSTEDGRFDVIPDHAKLSGPLPKTDNERKDRHKELFVKQAYDAAKLENDLKNNEIKSINNMLDKAEKKKSQITAEVQKDLRKQLAKSTSDAEREKIILEFANNLQKLADGIEKQKLKQLETLRRELLDRRRQKKKELHKSHIAEAKSHGLPPDGIPDMTIPSHEQLDQELRELFQTQEHAQAELKKSTAEIEDKTSKYDSDLQANIQGMKSSGIASDEVVKGLQNKAAESKRQANDLKQKLKGRKDRKVKKNLEDLQGLSEEERQKVLAIRQAQEEADRLNEENALISIFRMLQQVMRIWYIEYIFTTVTAHMKWYVEVM